MNFDAVRTFDDTLRTIGAANAADTPGKLPEALPRLVKIPFEVVIGQETQFIGDGHAFGALALALKAHAAVELADLLIAGK
mgnify:CR=1 FL=1